MSEDDNLSEEEKAYKKKVDEISPLIHAHVKLAAEQLQAAVRLAELHGVVFYAGVSPLGQPYRPRSAPAFDTEKLAELTGEYAEYEGWQHSAVC